MISLTVKNLHKTFGHPPLPRTPGRNPVPALQDVSVFVPAGHCGMVLGPNGSGKTTLLKIIATGLLPDSGLVDLGPFHLGRDDERIRANTGILLNDERSFYWRLTGRQNLEFFAALYGLNQAIIQDRIETLAQRFQMTYLDQRFDSYSSGMRRICGILRTFLHDPLCLLLDEPTRSLDDHAAHEFKTLTKEALSRGRSVLWVTHDLAEAQEFGDSFLILNQGHVVRSQPKTSTTDLAALYQAATSHA